MTPHSNFAELVLTCASWQEAQRIADTLLEQKLVTSMEFVEVKSGNWQQDHQHAIRLIMCPAADSFDKIEAEVAKLQSDETFALQISPVAHISQQAAARPMEVTHG